jgi:hypothetical protein
VLAMMQARDVLEHYIARHNRGVRSRDFEALLEIFTDSARLEFDGVRFGPFEGKRAIASAFRERPPSDELVLLTTTEPDPDVIEADYAVTASPKRRAGSLRMELSGASIVRLVIRVI